MYHYFENRAILDTMRRFGKEIMKELCLGLKDREVDATFYLVGSGARDLVTQNANEPIDLDYNLKIFDWDEYDEKELKELVMNELNKIMRFYTQTYVNDSTSCITTKQMYCNSKEVTGKSCYVGTNSVLFTFDICIVGEDSEGHMFRLKHEKARSVFESETWYWNQGPISKDLDKKVNYIKQNKQWEKVKIQYLNTKNRYLTQNDNNHPSFICYIEVINNVYNQIIQRNKQKSSK